MHANIGLYVWTMRVTACARMCISSYRQCTEGCECVSVQTCAYVLVYIFRNRYEYTCINKMVGRRGWLKDLGRQTIPTRISEALIMYK